MPVMLPLPRKRVDLTPIMNVTTPGIQILHHKSSGVQVDTDTNCAPLLTNLATLVLDNRGRSVDLLFQQRKSLDTH
jgi:hypothetical protein